MNAAKVSNLIYYSLVTAGAAAMTVSEVRHDKVVFAVLAGLITFFAGLRLVQTIRQ